MILKVEIGKRYAYFHATSVRSMLRESTKDWLPLGPITIFIPPAKDGSTSERKLCSKQSKNSKWIFHTSREELEEIFKYEPKWEPSAWRKKMLKNRSKNSSEA